MQKHKPPGILGLTLIPSKRDRALRGRKALSVLSDLIGPRSEKPKALAIRLTIDTYTDRDRQGDRAEEERTHMVRGDRARRSGPTRTGIVKTSIDTHELQLRCRYNHVTVAQLAVSNPSFRLFFLGGSLASESSDDQLDGTPGKKLVVGASEREKR